MAYASDKKPGELTALTTLATDDIFVVGDTSDASEVAKGITKANLITDLGTSFAAALGADDNYVTDAEKTIIAATTASYTTAEASKLAGIEALADVTDAGNVGSSIHGATAKTTPVDADTMPLIDSAASNVLKKVTWANIKATIKAYTDTLYAAALGADDNYVTDAEKAALHTHANKATLDNITAAYTTAEATKLGHISITQAVDLDALETASHAAVTVTDSTEIDFTLTGQDITASLKAGSIDETKLDTSVNASLDLADSALQPAAIGTTVQAYDAQLADIAALAVTDGNVIVGNGTNWVAESGATARTSLGLGTGDSPQFTGIELGHASDTTISRDSAGVIAVEGVVIPSISSTNTLTNKRVTPRVSSETSSATPTINVDNVDAHSITALATAITSMTTNLSGTPTNFQKLIIRIKDNGTARAITWGASFEAKGVALPTTTVISKVLTVGFIYDTVTSKWGCVASVSEA